MRGRVSLLLLAGSLFLSRPAPENSSSLWNSTPSRLVQLLASAVTRQKDFVWPSTGDSGDPSLSTMASFRRSTLSEHFRKSR